MVFSLPLSWAGGHSGHIPSLESTWGFKALVASSRILYPYALPPGTYPGEWQAHGTSLDSVVPTFPHLTYNINGYRILVYLICSYAKSQCLFAILRTDKENK